MTLPLNKWMQYYGCRRKMGDIKSLTQRPEIKEIRLLIWICYIYLNCLHPVTVLEHRWEYCNIVKSKYTTYYLDLLWYWKYTLNEIICIRRNRFSNTIILTKFLFSKAMYEKIYLFITYHTSASWKCNYSL